MPKFKFWGSFQPLRRVFLEDRGPFGPLRGAVRRARAPDMFMHQNLDTKQVLFSQWLIYISTRVVSSCGVSNSAVLVLCVRSLWTLQIIVEKLKVSDNKVAHHPHQEGAFGLNGDVSFTREGPIEVTQWASKIPQDSPRFPKIPLSVGPLRGAAWRPWAPAPPLFFCFCFRPT